MNEHRILLRLAIEAIAEELEAGRISKSDAAASLRSAANADAASLDEGDIELDFDAEAPVAAEMNLLPFIGLPKPTGGRGCPVEEALLKAVKLRDRGAALKIVGDVPGNADKAAYDGALMGLRDALNLRFPKDE
jgi:hypothetical protein